MFKEKYKNQKFYIFDKINSTYTRLVCVGYDDLINYYFSVNLIANYNKTRFIECDHEYDKPLDPFDYLFFLFVDRGLLMVGYLIIFYYYCLCFFFFLVCYYCWYHHIYSFDFNLYIEPLRMLTRNNQYNDYNDYKFLVFNYTKTDISDFFYEINIKKSYKS